MNWKLIAKSLKNSDMRTRILAVLGILLIFRVLAHVPIPLSNPETLKQVLENLFTSSNQQSDLLSFINVLSGGALANFSIMLVGLGPYINASIIMQLLTKAIPSLEALNKEGEFGRKKINQYTRMLTLPLAVVQSIGAIYLVRQQAAQVGGIADLTANTSAGQWILMIAALTGGAMMLMWLGELVTERGIGNGISLLITVGIVATLPSTISGIAGGIYTPGNNADFFGAWLPINQSNLVFGLILLFSTLIVTFLVVRLNEAKRIVTINYAKRVQGNRSYGGVTTILPVKLITAGVVPIIFAVAFLSVPAFVGQLLTGNSSARLAELGANLSIWFQTPTAQSFAQGGFVPYIYPLVYFLLVFLFTFFYTSITFNTHEIAENLQKQGGFVAGVRSGLQTEKYLGKLITRLTLFGAFALGLLAILPLIGQKYLASDIALGGTSILILVSVAIETLRSIESRALMVTYDQYEQPDFFYEPADAVGAATGAKRLRFLPGRGKKSSDKKK